MPDWTMPLYRRNWLYRMNIKGQTRRRLNRTTRDSYTQVAIDVCLSRRTTKFGGM